jgi:hypothetical protein
MLERDDHWTPPDSLGYSSLRPVRLTAQGKSLIVIMATLVIGAIVLGVFLGRTARRQNQERTMLREQGVTGDATVTRAWIDGSKERQRWIAYRFDYAGRGYTHRVKTPGKIWTGLRQGTAILISFVPSQPSVSHPIGWDGDALPFWLALLIAVMVAGSGFLLLIPVRRETRLLMEGRPAPGRVTGFKKTDKAIQVQYEFRLLNGAIVKGKANRSKPPVEGSPLCVLYDPENPRRNAIYPLSLVRLENAAAGREVVACLLSRALRAGQQSGAHKGRSGPDCRSSIR